MQSCLRRCRLSRQRLAAKPIWRSASRLARRLPMLKSRVLLIVVSVLSAHELATGVTDIQLGGLRRSLVSTSEQRI